MTKQPKPSKATSASQTSSPEMILTFRLYGERFALTVTHVNEILDPIEQTLVPNADPFSPSLINVRGAVAPLIDIRHRLGIPPATPDGKERIVVLDLPVGDQLTRLAILVDAVDEVIEADRNSLESIPELGARWPADYIEGIARNGEDLVVLLNPATLFDPTHKSANSASTNTWETKQFA